MCVCVCGVHIPYIMCIVRVCVCAVYIPWHRWRLLLLPGWHLAIEFRLVSLKVLLPTEPSHEFRSVPFQTRLHHFSSRFSIPSVSYFESRVFCCTGETCCRPTNSPLSGHKHVNTQRDTWAELAIPLQTTRWGSFNDVEVPVKGDKWQKQAWSDSRLYLWIHIFASSLASSLSTWKEYTGAKKILDVSTRRTDLR